MIISVDTEKMRTMTSLAQSVYSDIDSCVSVLMSVTEHNDWNCRERDEINENIQTVKSNVRLLQETVDVFSSAMTQVASMFDDFEASIPNKYQHIDSLLGSVFSVPCSQQTSNSYADGITSNVTAVMADAVRVYGGLENNVLGNLTKPLQVCKFSDVDFGESN